VFAARSGDAKAGWYAKLFPAHVMTYDTLDDIVTTMKYYSDAEFDLVLADAPSGIFDPRFRRFRTGGFPAWMLPPYSGLSRLATARETDADSFSIRVLSSMPIRSFIYPHFPGAHRITQTAR
jgi:hypothetical protein